ncbi:hypothetical protein [Siccirubricoccus deserti]|nr:hypothetical protein [Siccirubricoccus deserti]
MARLSLSGVAHPAEGMERSEGMSKSHLPPIPPAGRAPIGGSANAKSGDEMSAEVGRANKDSTDRHLGEQGRQGNIKQNTTNQGYQQDR